MNPRIEVLQISGDLVDQVFGEASRCHPREACGFMVGECRGTRAHVRRLRPAENRAARPDRFLIDAGDVFEAMRSAGADGESLLGVYHSHPDAGPEPSVTDLADAWHEWLYLIVSVSRPHPASPPASEARPRGREANMACWRWEGERFEPVRLRVGAETGEASP